MNFQRFNHELRKVLKNLVEDGFLQKDISSITFGLNRQDQLRAFLAGRDIYGKPLNRIFDSLNFELHIVPILKTDFKTQEKINKLSHDALCSIQLMSTDYLTNNQATVRKNNIFHFVDYVIKNIPQR